MLLIIQLCANQQTAAAPAIEKRLYWDWFFPRRPDFWRQKRKGVLWCIDELDVPQSIVFSLMCFKVIGSEALCHHCHTQRKLQEKHLQVKIWLSVMLLLLKFGYIFWKNNLLRLRLNFTTAVMGSWCQKQCPKLIIQQKVIVVWTKRLPLALSEFKPPLHLLCILMSLWWE